MADEAELQARIAALAGAINRHKQQQQPDPASHHAQNHHPYNPTPPYRGNHQYNNRWAPFPAPRGRGRGGYGASFQNRTLVNAPTSSTPPTPTGHHTPQSQQQAYPNRQERVTTASHHPSTPPANRDMVIEGVRFSLLEDGSKLVRMTGEPWDMHCTWTARKLINSCRNVRNGATYAEKGYRSWC